MTKSLLSVPQELLTSVFSCLSCHDLASVALVCTKLHTPAEYALYEHILLPPPSHRLDACPQVVRLRTALRDRPELASVIKSLSLTAQQVYRFVWLDDDISAVKPSYTVFPNTTMINLYRAHCMTTADLSHLLLSTPALKVLECDIECDPEPIDNRSPWLGCDMLGEALLQVRTTLVRLKISVDFGTYVGLDVSEGGSSRDGRGWGIESSLGSSLKQLEHLKEIEVPPVVLFGWEYDPVVLLRDVLPANLQTLTFASNLCDWWRYEWGRERLAEKVYTFLGTGAGTRGLRYFAVVPGETYRKPPYHSQKWTCVEELAQERGWDCKHTKEALRICLSPSNT